MPPKNKKLTKEERERLKREEEERRAAEEEALRIEREKEEEARLERERQERQEREHLQEIENDRFAVESQAVGQIMNKYDQNLANLRAEEKKRLKWERYLNCDATPDPSVESELNTYVSLWDDDIDRKPLKNQLAACEEMKHIIGETKKLLKESDADAMRFSKSCLLLQDMLDDRLDLATLHVLQFAEAYCDGDTQNLSVSAQSDHVTIGIWANTTKNPKIKNFTFEARDFSSEFPKHLVLANVALRLMITRFDHLSPRCVLYRMAVSKAKKKKDEREGNEIQTGNGSEVGDRSVGGSRSDIAKSTVDEDRESTVSGAKSRSPSAKSSVAGDRAQSENATLEKIDDEALNVGDKETGDGSILETEEANGEENEEEDEEREELLDDENVVDLRQLSPVGGLIHLDLLQLPPQPKTVNNWTMREVIDSRLVKLPYPAGAKASAPVSQPILAMNMKLPISVFFPEEPRLARWEDGQNCWRTDGITDAIINHEDRSISFKSQYICPLAIMMDRYVHMPFQQWQIRPMGLGRAQLSIKTAANIELEIEIEDGLCSLSMPDDLDEIKGILNRKVSPERLQELMFNAGLNIFPAEDGNKYVSIIQKDSSLESSVYLVMALLVPSVAMSWSRWNSDAPSDKIILQAVESMNTRPIKDGAWNTFMAAGRSGLLAIDEDSEEFREELKERTEVHPDIFNVYKASGASAGGLKRISEAKVGFTDCIHHLLKATRLLTYS